MKSLAALLALSVTLPALASPVELFYDVQDDPNGGFRYRFWLMQVDAGSYSFGWMIPGDEGSVCQGGASFRDANGQYPTVVGNYPGPWTSLSTSSGGHTGPVFQPVLDAWSPYGVGDYLHWEFTHTEKIDVGTPFYWSAIVGSTPFNCVQMLGLDEDGDGIPIPTDNCWIDSNADQADDDGDGIGNLCDPCPNEIGGDRDGDGVCDSVDPCPNDNPDDPDGDGICTEFDACPNGDDRLDADADGQPDACDPCPNDNPDDSDLDGVCDSNDQCPNADDNLDADFDGTPDGCDTCPGGPDNLDADGDGICDALDTCPGGDDTLDSDGDGICDAADDCIGTDATGDVDGDGYCADVDCDDTAADTYPGAPELCDGADNACLGTVPADEFDTDGDGYTGCEDDCDDSNADVSPAAAEACDDAIDNNCDGNVDEDCGAAPGAESTSKGGCGCASSGLAEMGLLLPLLALVGVRRRR